MIEPMPHSLPPYLQKDRTRHGKLVWYVRRGKGPRVRVRGEYGSQEFEAAYFAALGGEAPPAKPLAAAGTLSWLVARYQDSAVWARLAPATRSKRANIYKVACRGAGDVPYSGITKAHIAEGRDRRRGTPFAANEFLKAMRALFQWALASGFVKDDPTLAARGFGHKTQGFHCWTDHEINRFEERWPLGTRERLAFAILLYTGLRRGDAAILGRQHVRGGVIVLRTAKTGVVVEIPILPPLAEAILATARGEGLAFIATASGTPMSNDRFGHWFKDACRAAGIPGTAHGLRKAGATRAAENGATEAELEAIFGWRGGHMASTYTRAANRAALARGAITKLERATKS
jgi:integrase